MKTIFSILASFAIAGSAFAGCPSKTVEGKIVKYNEDSKKIKIEGQKKQIKVSGSTKKVGFDNFSELVGKTAKLEGCNCGGAKKVTLPSS